MVHIGGSLARFCPRRLLQSAQQYLEALPTVDEGIKKAGGAYAEDAPIYLNNPSIMFKILSGCGNEALHL